METKEIKTTGLLSFIFAILSIFTFGIIFVPIAIIFRIIGYLKKEYLYSTLGLLFSMVGIVTSPVIWICSRILLQYVGIEIVFLNDLLDWVKEILKDFQLDGLLEEILNNKKD